MAEVQAIGLGRQKQISLGSDKWAKILGEPQSWVCLFFCASFTKSGSQPAVYINTCPVYLPYQSW